MTHSTGPGRRRTLLHKLLPTIAAAGIGAAGLVGCSSGEDSGGQDAKAGKSADKSAVSSDTKASRDTEAKGTGIKLKTTTGEFGTKAAAAADFPTWGTRWVVHQTADLGSPSVGMINQGAPGQDRISADYQVNTGKRVCEDGACSTYMAHITKPVNGFLTVVAVDIPEDSLPGVPVQNGAEPPKPPQTGGTRAETLQRASTWLTANNGTRVPYSQAKMWKDGYRQDCSGYVSMALGLKAPGTNTVGLASSSITKPIALNDLQPGDLLIDASGDNNTRHVVMFEKWNDAAHTSYTSYEQRGDFGTDHTTRRYGLEPGSEYKPYRPLKFAD
ncbi:hypothetical protein [Streptomyces sp. ME19-01-6]|uniref:hypothetical protein n=1 Tax=Streptomyces sp. ME19-01-6 TaxID=3028686 RepID=UPI0029A117AC|nr:hypothetical protein [Streptomyces sp. ME19-01-6]MDX3226892.1 hypothetical protein [Streptomyces sp. ME19-01-6]